VTELELADGNLVMMLAEAGPQVIVAVAHAVDHRSPVTQGHSSRVVAIADAIGKRSNVASSDIESLRAAAFLHDVGHMTLPSGGQGFEVPGHCEEGEKIVAGADFSAEVVAAVRHHHDRWDASRDQVPVIARILAVSERYEALTAGRGCARVTPQDALARVKEGAGTEFDPVVVEALGRAVQDGGLELNLPDIALPAVAARAESIAAS
jgi:putative nucleotidyltransferase with HDIG domain